MAYDCVRPARDELVVVAYRHLPGEEPAERAVAPHPDEPAREPEQQRDGGRRGELQRCGGVRAGRWEEQRGEDAGRVGLREAVGEEDDRFGEGGPA